MASNVDRERLALTPTNESMYEYKKVRVQDDVGVEAQNYANQGWRTVSVFREKPVVLGHVAKFEVLHLLIERVKLQSPSGT